MKRANNKGITLIALIITIIVLIILAGISISIAIGDNGIASKALKAKGDTIVAQEKEFINLGYTGASIENEGTYANQDVFQHELDLLAGENMTEISADDEGNFEVLFLETGNIYFVNNNIPKELAINKLIIDEEAEADKTPYVLYNGILCRVLYNDSEHGLEIISDDAVEITQLGSLDTVVSADDFEYNGTASMTDTTRLASASYNRAITTLNESAEKYLDANGIANRARCVGSNPFDPKDIEETNYTFSGSFMTRYGLNNLFKVADNNYQFDYDRMVELGIDNCATNYWLASRYIQIGNGSYYGLYLWVRRVTRGGNGAYDLVRYMDNGTTSCANSTAYGGYPGFGLRPVFRINNDAHILKGDGTIDSPYVLIK